MASLVDDFERNGSDVAVVVMRGLRRRETTYSALASLCRRFAAELARLGIGKGERVLICGENSTEWIAAFFGCVLRGVLAVPLDVASAPAFFDKVVKSVSPKLILRDPELAALAESITPDEAGAIAGLTADDPLQIIFTSGTTSEPKGIVHTHGNVLASLLPIEREIRKYIKYERVFHPLRFLHTLPLSHVFGQFMGLWTPPLLAAEVHFETRLVASEMAARIRRERISLLACVPRVLELLEQQVLQQIPGLAAEVEAASGISVWQRWWRFRRAHKLFGFKFWACVCGGASLPAPLEQFWGRMGFLVVQGYGMTETTALVSLNHPFRAASGTVGQVLPGREVRLSEEGEVLVRGATISNSIWQGGDIRKAESDWLATGDLAEFDPGGNLRFRGRKKDLIVTAAGLNIYPEDLEAALLEQPGVKAVAVVENDSANGPEAVAALVMAPDAEPAGAIAGANEKLADFQQIRRWMVWPEPDLPRTSTGKVIKREIVARLQTADAENFSTEELALDSLGRVELQAKLEEQYGVALDDAALQQVKTLADAQKLIVSGASQAASTASPHIYPRWPWNPFVHFIRALFLEVIARPLTYFLTKPKISSAVTNWPRTPVFVVANHITSYDVPFILWTLPPRLRHNVAVAMSGEMLLDFRRGRNQGNWFLNLLAPAAYFLITGLFNVFPLPQRSGFRRSFQHAGAAVDRGYSVLVFPEGRRSDDGTPQRFLGGAGLLWKELGIPAVAVRLEGLGEIKATRARWFRAGSIRATATTVLPAQPELSPEELTTKLYDAVFQTSP
ncbi:MAG TPA: AMP-binding protein [Bryobacteraceae bacterium]|nr:AMP-binding protein [Bryobacteraceae bacterium]